MKKRSNICMMLRLVKLVRPLAHVMIAAILFGVAGFVCANFLTIIGAYGVLSILGVCEISLSLLFCLMVFAAILRGVLHYAEQSCNHFIAFKLLAIIRDIVFAKLRKLCPAKLEGKEKGNLISVITSDIELLEVFYAHTISPIVIAFFMTVIMTVFFGHFYWGLALYALCAYLVIGVCMPVGISRAGKDYGEIVRNKSGELSSFVLESLRGLKEILQYGNGFQRIAKMNEKTDELTQVSKKAKTVAGMGMALTGGLILSFSIGMFLISTALFSSGKIEAGAVFICTVAMFSSFGPVTALSNLGSTLQSTFAAANRVFDLLDESPQVAENQEGDLAKTENIQVQKIDFSYETEEILKDFSLDFPNGGIFGIVGKSGCGKSTLLKLLMRFFDVEKGKITLSGTDIRALNTKSLREAESYVTQETYLFHDSIENNLKLGQEYSAEEMIQACKKASVHDFIMTLPQKYQTSVGELGDTLSGGERQRLGIARAFLHQAPIMLLDEPTSNLDSLNEGIILKALDEEREKRMIILVSHRPSTMSVADTIFQMENGRRKNGVIK